MTCEQYMKSKDVKAPGSLMILPPNPDYCACPPIGSYMPELPMDISLITQYNFCIKKQKCTCSYQGKTYPVSKF